MTDTFTIAGVTLCFDPWLTAEECIFKHIHSEISSLRHQKQHFNS